MTTKIKSDLKYIAEHLPANASYTDVMYELYVRMKISKGRQAVKEGRTIAHSDVKKRFSK
jgi:hypothetical protein